MSHKIFPAELENLHEMLIFIENESQLYEVPATLKSKITLAAEEALVNIIHYGYPKLKGVIEILCEGCTDRKGFSITIKDQGIPFDPIHQAPTPSTSPQIQQYQPVGGYGIHLFVGVMDNVEYQRTEEGNRLTLIKYL